jgi:hypothetical protein
VTAGVEAAVGALADAGALAADGDEALLDEVVGDESEPPPPPQAARTTEASKDNVNVALFFISVFLFGERGQSDPLFHAVS